MLPLLLWPLPLLLLDEGGEGGAERGKEPLDTRALGTLPSGEEERMEEDSFDWTTSC